MVWQQLHLCDILQSISGKSSPIWQYNNSAYDSNFVFLQHSTVFAHTITVYGDCRFKCTLHGVDWKSRWTGTHFTYRHNHGFCCQTYVKLLTKRSHACHIVCQLFLFHLKFPFNREAFPECIALRRKKNIQGVVTGFHLGEVVDL